MKILDDPNLIKFIPKPTLQIQLLAVSIDGLVIQYIKNPSIKVQLEAVKNEPYSIYYIHNPNFELIQLALSIEPSLQIDINHLSQGQQNYIKLTYGI